jgi:perosamine synthetase
MRRNLAMFGGQRAVELTAADKASIAWPIVTDAERKAVLAVLDGGGFTVFGAGRAIIEALERDWASFIDSAHCAAVSSGTAGLELAFAAADLEPGAEVITPALSFIASAAAPAQRMLIPVFADIDPVTFTLDPDSAAAAITARTQAILAVHLHGLPCDMARLRLLADRHKLLLVEDAAQAHAATYRGRMAGTLGDIAAFSLNPAKNLPTCGEGGLATTDDDGMHDRLVRYRQFGEALPTGPSRAYLSRLIAGNAKLSAVQAAFTLAQLERLPARHADRTSTVRRLLARLGELPGLIVPSCPQESTHAWHILRFRFDVRAMGCPDVRPAAMRAALQRALRAEGVPVRQYQQVPLPGQPAFQDLIGFAGYPWRLPGASRPSYRAQDFPVSMSVIDDSLTLQRWHLNPASEPVLTRCADAFEKVWEHRYTLATIARAAPARYGRRQPARIEEA